MIAGSAAGILILIAFVLTIVDIVRGAFSLLHASVLLVEIALLIGFSGPIFFK
jgi:hypothetical protein